MVTLKIVCLSGKAESGKTTAANAMAKEWRDAGLEVLIANFGDLVKHVCAKFFNWDGDKDESGRFLLQYVGTHKVRGRSPDYWVNFIASMLTFCDDEWDVVILADTRFPNEIEVLKEFGFDVTTVRIDRPNHVSKLTPEQKQNESETALDDYDFDWRIENSTDDLKEFEFIVKGFLRLCLNDDLGIEDNYKGWWY